MKAFRWLPWIALAVLPLVLHSNFILTIFIFSFILGMAAVSFNLIFGFTGQLSMFHAAAFGIAAYVTYLVVSLLHVSFWVAPPADDRHHRRDLARRRHHLLQIQAQGILFRRRHLAFSELARLVVLNWNSVTNGTLGLMVLDKPSVWIPGDRAPMKIDGTIGWYYFSLVGADVHGGGVCAGAALLDRPLLRRDPPQRRSGADPRDRHLPLQASVVYDGQRAGCGRRQLYAFYTGYIEPSYLSIEQSLDIIAMVLLGGRSSIIGPIVGAFVLTGLPHVIELSAELPRHSLRPDSDPDHSADAARDRRHSSELAPCCLRCRA